jgi:hypothetical protein
MVKLQAIAVRVIEVDPLAKAVVLTPGEGTAVVEHALDGFRQLAPVGVEDGNVIQAGVPLVAGVPPSLSKVFRPIWWW